MKYSIIIPVYNEAKYIQQLIDTFSKQQKQNLIIVDDGSTDKTVQILEKNKINFLKHKLNLGKGKALQTGTLQAIKNKSDIVIFMDGDLQHKTSDIQKFLDEFNKNSKTKIIFGARNIGTKMTLKAFLGNKIITIIINLLFNYYLSDTQCGFRAFKTDIYKLIEWESSNYSVETEIIINAAKHQIPYSEVPIHTIYIDNYKGTNFIDGFKILSKIIIWKLTK